MRYLPLTNTDRSAMLETVGASSIDDLFVDVPQEPGELIEENQVGIAIVGQFVHQFGRK